MAAARAHEGELAVLAATTSVVDAFDAVILGRCLNVLCLPQIRGMKGHRFHMLTGSSISV
jgi:hypothetical protein